MAGLPFNRLPASGPMAQQAEQEYKAMREAAGQEYEIEMKALGNQYLTDEQYNNKAAVLHGKHSVKALQMNRQWDQRMTMIQQYEKLGEAGTLAPGRVSQEQFALSGYDVPARKKPDLWAEHQKLISERGRMEQYLLDTWGKRWGKTRRILETNDKGKVTDWGRVATEADQAGIDEINRQIKSLDQYEFALMTQMDPQHRKVNQLSRAMAMGPRVSATPGVGGRRTRVPVGTAEPKVRERERLETPGYKMTREKAITQAQRQLGTQASKERILALAKQIYEAE